MAKDKNGFILYADQMEIFDQLSDLKAGKLIKHIFSYVNDENPISKDQIINLAFTPIKLQLKRDLKHWESVRESRSKAGKASAAARAKKKQKATNSTHVKSVQQKSTNPTVTVKDTVKVNVNDNVNEILNRFDFDFKVELLNYIKYLQETFNRDIGHMQIEQSLRMLDSWYDSKNKKVLCLAANISNGWKTLNYVEVSNTGKKEKANIKL